MQRRKFLAAAVAASTVPLAVSAGIPPAARIKVLDTYLTNTDQFPDGTWPAPGTPLQLRRDPRRAFDPRSVLTVDGSGSPPGYVPPASAQVLAALMDHGTLAEATAGPGDTLTVFIIAA